MAKKKTNEVSTKKQKAPKEQRGKFGAKKTIVDGIKFDSIMESEYYIYLKAEKKAKRIKSFELQPEYILQESYIIVDGVAYMKSHESFGELKKKYKPKTILPIKYRSDFLVTYNDNSIKVIDVKGKETADFKIKRKMFDLKYPHLNLQLVQQRGKQGNKYWADFDELKLIAKDKKKEKKAAK